MSPQIIDPASEDGLKQNGTYAELVAMAATRLRMDGSTTRAVQGMLDNRGLLTKKQIDILIKLGLHAVVRNAANGLRQQLVRQAWSVPDSEGQRVAARLRVNGTPYDWPLPGGAPIGDATVTDLGEAMKLHNDQIAGHQKRLDFYNKVRERLVKSGAATVREGIPEQELQELQKAA